MSQLVSSLPLLFAVTVASASTGAAPALGLTGDKAASDASMCTPELRQKCGSAAPAPAAQPVRKKVVHRPVAAAPVSVADAPPNAQPGECFACVVTPPKYEAASEQVLLAAATKRVEIVPAQYGADTETVVLKEASKRLEVVPATYKTVTEQVEVTPASKRLEVVPATYETVTERVLVREAYTTWKRGRSWIGAARSLRSRDGGTLTRDEAAAKASDDEVMCLVEVPAEYKTVTHKVEKTAAATREIEIPATYKTVSRQVVDQPATTREIDIPDVTKTIAVKKLVSPAQERVIEVPAQYQTVMKTRQVAAGSQEWRSVLCEVNATPGKIMEIQRALSAAGYNPGPLNGTVTPATMRAVNDYQAAKALPSDSYINTATVKSLGVSLN